MDIDLKRRLVGVIVVFSLLIIFLPIVFEEDESEERLEQLLAAPILHDEKENKEYISKKESRDLTQSTEQLEDKNGLEQQFIFSNKPDKINQQTELKNAKPREQSKLDRLNQSIVDDNMTAVKQEPNGTPDIAASNSKIKTQRDKASKIKTIKYSILNTNSLARTEVYAIKINSLDKGKSQKKIKDLLLSLGLPAYTLQTGADNSVYVGPDYELKYIKELANRIVEETEFEPEIIIQNNKLS